MFISFKHIRDIEKILNTLRYKKKIAWKGTRITNIRFLNSDIYKETTE